MTKKPIGRLIAAAGLTAAVGAVVRHGRRTAHDETDGGVLVPNPAFYDKMSGLLFGSLFNGITDDIAHVTPVSGQILEVGCGPGHLAIRLSQHGFTVTALDLDPGMIKRAQTKQSTTDRHSYAPPDFQVGDVAELPFPDATFDVVVSTLSMHHWADRAAGLAEIGRVLKPGGRVVIWDFRPGVLHSHPPAPEDNVEYSLLQVTRSTPWHWPWRLRLLQRTELTTSTRQ